MSSPFAYMFILLAGVAGISVVFLSEPRRRYLRDRRFQARAVALCGAWFVLDQIALYLEAWAFPAGGTLPVRVLELPLEELVLFYLHSVATILSLEHLSRDYV